MSATDSDCGLFSSRVYVFFVFSEYKMKLKYKKHSINIICLLIGHNWTEWYRQHIYYGEDPVLRQCNRCGKYQRDDTKKPNNT